MVHREHPATSLEALAQNVDASPVGVALPAPVRRSPAASLDERRDPGLIRLLTAVDSPVNTAACPRPIDALPAEEAVDSIVDECFFTVGQVVGDRKTVDVTAVIWWRDHYRTKFLAALKRFGNRWRADGQNVTAVGRLLAERAVEHAGQSSSIGQQSAMNATADAERYCTLHAMRRIRSERARPDGQPGWTAGYWCGDPGVISV